MGPLFIKSAQLAYSMVSGACHVRLADSSISSRLASHTFVEAQVVGQMSKPDKKFMVFPLGMALGIAIGAAAGLAIDNIAIGIGVGISLALVLGMLFRVMRIVGVNDDGRKD